MKNFIYMVQGDAGRIGEYLHLRERPGADAVFLTYDQEREGCIFFPNSTWTQGRNRMLAEARKLGDYRYFIFMDDDVEFVRGGHDEFESSLLQLRPAAATPIFPCIRGECIGLGNPFGKWFIPLLNHQIFWHSDPQMIAYHCDVIHDGIALPLIESFESENWHFSSQIHLSVLRSFYGEALLHFNHIAVANDLHRPYPRTDDCSTADHWLAAQFTKDYKPFFTPNFQLLRFIQRLLLPIKARYFNRDVAKGIVGPVVHLRKILNETRAYRPRESYRVNPQIVAERLHSDSPLYHHYLRHRTD